MISWQIWELSEYIPLDSVIEILARSLTTLLTAVANCSAFTTRLMDSLRDSRSICMYFVWMQESRRFISAAQDWAIVHKGTMSWASYADLSPRMRHRISYWYKSHETHTTSPSVLGMVNGISPTLRADSGAFDWAMAFSNPKVSRPYFQSHGLEESL